MVSVIASILSSSLGLLLNKVRNITAEKLKDGDITDGTLREMIVDDLKDVKAKLEGLSRKDLLSSYCFLKEGVDLLNLALDEANSKQTTSQTTLADETQDNGSIETTTQAEAATTKTESVSSVLNEVIALSNAIQKLKSTSGSRLVHAINCFRKARENATEAFCNEALSLQDRIMAAKLRVVSKILECLQDTTAAISGSKIFLKELHSLPAIGETVSTYFKDAMKSRFNKAMRFEHLKSVLSLNFGLANFAARFSGDSLCVRNWPRIHLNAERETIHPLFLGIDFITKIFDEEEFELPDNQLILPIDFSHCVTNSKGLLLTVSTFDKQINISSRKGVMKRFCELPLAAANTKGSLNPQKVEALAVDHNDNVYVIISFENSNVLFIFDSSGKKQCENELYLIGNTFNLRNLINCLVDKFGNIFICDNVHIYFANYFWICQKNRDDKTIHAREFALENISSHQHSHRTISLECITERDELIILAEKFANTVLVYTAGGELKRKIKVKDAEVLMVAYNNVTSKIEVLAKKRVSFFGSRKAYCILSYSENNEVECLYLPTEGSVRNAWFLSHPAGLAAFAYRRHQFEPDAKIIFM